MSLYDSLGETAFSINDPTISRAPPFKYTRAIAYNGKYWLAAGTVTVRSLTIKTFADVNTIEGVSYSEDGQIRRDSVRYSKEQAASYLPARIGNKNANIDLAKEVFVRNKNLNYVPQPYTRRSVHCFAKSTDGFNWKYVEECPFIFEPLTSSTSAGDDNYTRVNAVAWNGTKWMAVGRGSGTLTNTADPESADITVVESTDGDTWTITGRGYIAYNVRPELNMIKSPSNTTQGYTAITSNEMFCVTCDTTKWIVGGDNGLWKKGFTETSWTSLASNVERTRYLGIATDGTNWVAVGGRDGLSGFYEGSGTNAGAIVSSVDGGVTWTIRAPFDMYPDPTQQTFKAVAWNGDKWLAVGNRGPQNQAVTTGIIAVSEDGVDWTIAEGFSTGISCVSWDGNEWFVGSTNGNVMVSKDGFQWRTTDEDTSGTLTIATPIVLPILGGDLNTVQSLVVGSGNPTSVIRSYDNINWVNQVLTDDKKFFKNEIRKPFYGVVWSGTKWVIVGERDVTGKPICVSSNGIDWTYPTTTLDKGRDIAYGGGLYVAVGDSQSSSGLLVTSSDAETWTSRTSPLTRLRCVGYNGTKWVAGGKGGIIYSADGLTWTKSVTCPLTTVNDVAWNGSYWVAVGKGSVHNIALSIDSIRWYIASNDLIPFIEGKSVAWNRSRWIAVGEGDQAVATSIDGYTWSLVYQSQLLTGNYVTWTGSKWLIAGYGPFPVSTSTDSVTWTGYPFTLTEANGFASKDVSLPITGTSGSYNTSLITNVVADLTQKVNATLAEEAAAAALAADQAAQAAALVKRNATKATADIYYTRNAYWNTTVKAQFEPLKNKTYVDLSTEYPSDYQEAEEIINLIADTYASVTVFYETIYNDLNSQTDIETALEVLKSGIKQCEENVVTFYNLIRVLYKQLTNRTKLALTPTTMPDLLYNWGFSTTQIRDVVRGFYIIKANAISALSTSIQTTCDIPVTRVTYSDGTSTATNYKALYNSMFTFDLQNLPTTYKTDDSNAFYFLNSMNTTYTKMYPFKQQCDALVTSAINESNKWATLAGETAPTSTTVRAAFSTVYTKYFGVSESLFIPTYPIVYGNSLAYTDISVQAFKNIADTYSRPIAYAPQLDIFYTQARDKLNLVESNRSSALNYVKTKRQTTIKDKLVEFANTVKSDYSGPTLQIDLHAEKLSKTLLHKNSDYVYCMQLARCLKGGAQLYPGYYVGDTYYPRLRDLVLAVPRADIEAEEDGVPRPEGGWGTTYKLYPLVEVDLVTVSNSKNVNEGASLLIGERIAIPGASIPGGSTPANNILLTVTKVDRNGKALNYTVSGTLPSSVTFTGVTGSRFVNSTVKLRVVSSGVGYTVQLISGQQGSGYSVGQVLRVPGTQLFRKSPTNDILATVTQTGTNGAVTAISVSGNSEISTVDDVPSYRNTRATFRFLSSVDKSPSLLDNFIVVLESGGLKYAVDDVIPFKGTEFGGKSPANDVSIIVDEVDSYGTILKFHTVGTPATYKKYGGYGGVYSNVDAGILLSSKENETATFTIGEFTVVPTFLGNEKMIATSIAIKHKGSGYVAGDKILISGKNFPGGKSPLNDIAIKVITIGENGRIETFQVISQNFEFLVASKDVTTSILEQNATFNITRSYVSNPTYTVVLNSAGDGYVVGETITIPGENLGGKTPQNNVVVTVTGIGSAGAITSFTHTGTPVATLRVDTTPPDALIKLTAKKQGKSGLDKLIATLNTRDALSNFLGVNSNDLNGVRYMSLSDYDGIYGRLSLPEFLAFTNTETYDSIASKINTLNTKLTALIANDEMSAEYIDTLVAADLATIQSQVLPAATAYINGIISSVERKNIVSAKFNVSWANDQYTTQLVAGGFSYEANEELTLLGTEFGGTTPANDLVLKVLTVEETKGDEFGKILTFQRKSGTPAFSSSVTRAFDSVKSASFDVEIANRVYTVTLVNPGSGYTVNTELTFLGTGFGGTTPANDLVLKVLTVGTSGQILTFEKKSGTAIPTPTTGNTVVTYNKFTSRFSSIAAAQATIEENYATLLNLPSTLTGKTNTQIASILFNAGVTIVNAIKTANGDYDAKLKGAIEYLRLYAKDKARVFQTKDDLTRWIQMKKNAIINSPFLAHEISNGVGDPFIMSIPPTDTTYWIQRQYPTYTLTPYDNTIYECTLDQTTGKVVTTKSVPLDVPSANPYVNTEKYREGSYVKYDNQIYVCIKDNVSDIIVPSTTDEIKDVHPTNTQHWKERRYPDVTFGNEDGEYNESLSTLLNVQDYRDYSASKEYMLGSIVRQNDLLYLCKNIVNNDESIQGIPPTNVSYWKEVTYPTVTKIDGTSLEGNPSSFTALDATTAPDVLYGAFKRGDIAKTTLAFVDDSGYYREGPITFQLDESTESVSSYNYPPVFSFDSTHRYQNYLMWEWIQSPTSAISTKATPYSNTTAYKVGDYVSYTGQFYNSSGRLKGSTSSNIFKLIAPYYTRTPNLSNAAAGALYRVTSNYTDPTTSLGVLPTTSPWQRSSTFYPNARTYSNTVTYTTYDYVNYTDPADGQTYSYQFLGTIYHFDFPAPTKCIGVLPTKYPWQKLNAAQYPPYSNTKIYYINSEVSFTDPADGNLYDYRVINLPSNSETISGIVPTTTAYWEKIGLHAPLYEPYSNTTTYNVNNGASFTDPTDGIVYYYKFTGALQTYDSGTTAYILFGTAKDSQSTVVNKTGWAMRAYPAVYYNNVLTDPSTLPLLNPASFSAYSSSAEYSVGALVSYTNKVYRVAFAKHNSVVGIPVENTRYWKRVRYNFITYDDELIEAAPGAVPLLDSDDFDEYDKEEFYIEGDVIKVTNSRTQFNLKGPMDVVTNQDGNIFVIDTGNFLIKEVLFNNNDPTVVNIGVQHFTYEFKQAGRVGEYDYNIPILVSKLVDGTTTTASYSDSLRAIAVDDATNTIYFSDSNRIRKITSSGNITSYTTGTGYQDGAAADAKFSSQISGLIFDPDLNCLYVSDTLNHRIRIIASDGTVTTLAGSTAGFLDGSGSAARFNYPGGIDRDSDGNLYVADTGNHCIRKVTPLGVVTRIAGSYESSGYVNQNGIFSRFSSPYGIAVDSLGDIYVADTGNHCIRKVSSSGNVTTFAGTNEAGLVEGDGEDARFNSPRGMSFDKFDNLFVADSGNNRIRRIRPDSRVLSAVKDQATIYECIDSSTENPAIQNIPPTNTEYWEKAYYPTVYIDGIPYQANPTDLKTFKPLDQYDYHRYDNNWMYKVGDRVAYNGGVYDCINTDYVEPVDAHIVDVPPTNDLYWQVVDAYESITSNLSSWYVKQDYKIGDMAMYLNKPYSCVEEHTSTSNDLPVRSIRWLRYTTPAKSLQPVWSPIKYYAFGDIVLYVDKLYQCAVENYTIDRTKTPDINPTVWRFYDPKTLPILNWAVNVYYRTGKVINYTGFKYICVLAHTSTDLERPDYKLKWKPAEPLKASSIILWDLNMSYSEGSLVLYDGYFYRCEEPHYSSFANSPPNDRITWSKLQTLSEVGLPNMYSPETLYSAGDTVTFRVGNNKPAHTQDFHTVQFYRCIKSTKDAPSEFTYDSIAFLESKDGNGNYQTAKVPGTWNKNNLPRYGVAEKDPFRIKGFAGRLRRKVWMEVEAPYRRLEYLNDYQYYLEFVPRAGETPPASYGSAYIASTFSSSSSTIATPQTDPTYGYTFNTYQSVLRPDDFAADQEYLTTQMITVINDFKATKTEEDGETMKIEDVILGAYGFLLQELEDAKTLPYEPKTENISTDDDQNKCIDQLIFEINTMKMQYFYNPGVQAEIQENPYKFMSAVGLAQTPPAKLFRDLGVGDLAEMNEYLQLHPDGGGRYGVGVPQRIRDDNEILDSKLELVSLRCYEAKLKVGFLIATTMLAGENKMGGRFFCDSGMFDLPIGDWDTLANFRNSADNGLLQKLYALINTSVSPPEYTLPTSEAARGLAVLTYETQNPVVKGLENMGKGVVGLTVGLFEGATTAVGQMVNGLASLHAATLEAKGKPLDDSTSAVVTFTTTNFTKFNRNNESIALLKQQADYYRNAVANTEITITEEEASDAVTRIGVMLQYVAQYERQIRLIEREIVQPIPPRIQVPNEPTRVVLKTREPPKSKALIELGELRKTKAELVRQRARYIAILDGLSGRPPFPKFIADIPELVTQTIERTLNVDPPPNPYIDKLRQTRIRLAVQTTVIFENEAALRRLNNDLKSLIPDNGKYSRLAGSITSYTNGQLGGFLFDAGKNFPFTFAGQEYTLDSFLALSNESKISLGNNLRSSAASTAETIATTRTRISEITQTLAESRKLRVGIRGRALALQSLSSKYLQRWRAANPTQSIIDYSARELTGDELWDQLEEQVKAHDVKVKEIQAERYILDVQEDYYKRQLNLTQAELDAVRDQLRDGNIENNRIQLENDRNIAAAKKRLTASQARQAVLDKRYTYLKVEYDELARRATNADATRRNALIALQDNVKVELESISFQRNQQGITVAINAVEVDELIVGKYEITGSMLTKCLKNTLIVPFEIAVTSLALLTGVGQVPYRVEELASGVFMRAKLPAALQARIDSIPSIVASAAASTNTALSAAATRISTAFTSIANEIGRPVYSITPTISVSAATEVFADAIDQAMELIRDRFTRTVVLGAGYGKYRNTTKIRRYGNPTGRFGGYFQGGRTTGYLQKRLRKLRRVVGGPTMRGIEYVKKLPGRTARATTTAANMTVNALGTTPTLRFFGGLGVGMEIAGAVMSAYQGGAFTEGETLGF
jgi:sugar lactone lactonase YvrE